MNNLLEYLKLSLEFIKSEDVDENIVMAFLDNIKSVSKSMPFDEIEEFSKSLDDLVLLYEHNVDSINAIKTDVDFLDTSDETKDAFKCKMSEYNTRLCNAVKYLGNLNEFVKERLIELRPKAL